MNIAFQLELRPPIFTVYGPVDYMDFRSQLEQMDNLLTKSHIEDHLICKLIDPQKANPKKIQFLYTAIRCQILLHLTDMSYRELAYHLADSELFRWFANVNTITGAKTPSKSTLQRMEHICAPLNLSEMIHELNRNVSDPKQSEKLLHDDTPIIIKDLFADSTCIKANIHYPVDWLLFRDAENTLLGSIKLIRKQGLMHRMPDPQELIKQVNQLSIEMTQSSRKRKGKKERKRIFREMKRHLKTTSKHAKRYYDLLKEKWSFTEWSEKQAQQVLNRMSNVMEQIPPIIEVAHARIISEKKVDNEDKILSLYEKNVHVIKRGKMNAEVEFGNGFYLAEQSNGIIVDWDFFKEYPKADSIILPESIKRVKENYKIESFASDRGFNSLKNDNILESEEIFNATCPRNPHELTIKMKDDKFREAQRRRAQTEGRIGIFKNKFIGEKIFRKGFENKEIKILWSIFTHNLWVIARMARDNYIRKKESERKKVA
jgi:hypothetical protein